MWVMPLAERVDSIIPPHCLVSATVKPLRFFLVQNKKRMAMSWTWTWGGRTLPSPTTWSCEHKHDHKRKQWCAKGSIICSPSPPSLRIIIKNSNLIQVADKHARSIIVRCKDESSPSSSAAAEYEYEYCVGTGLDVECVDVGEEREKEEEKERGEENWLWEWAVLISPFFFWGTSMVAMKEVLPKTGPFFVSAFRLIPAGLLLISFAYSSRRQPPFGLAAWFSIALFGLVDASCFQGFLAQGLQRTSAGLGSVIIDSQPLTVAIIAALLFGESIGVVGAIGLVLGVVGLLLLELPAVALQEESFSLWGSGEWWMLLAAQSMAIGTVMVRWVSNYADPVMATGWHMVIGGIPLVFVSMLNHDPAFTGSLQELSKTDLLALLYTSIFGSAISYGVYFYSAAKGSLTKLSSLTFLTPMFASVFGYLYLGETFTPLQLFGAIVTLAAIYMVNYQSNS